MKQQQSDFAVGIVDVALRLHPGDRRGAALMAEHALEAWREACLRKGKPTATREECRRTVRERLGN